MKIIYNTDKEVLDCVEQALARMERDYGKKYCPCKLERNDDIICMCKEFREQDYPGECHCGRFIKVDD